MHDVSAKTPSQPPRIAPGLARRGLLGACLAHATFDGATELLTVFYPVWQQQFHLSFTEVGLLRTAWSGTLALLQIPATALGERLGLARAMFLATTITALAQCAASFSTGLTMLVCCLILGGIGGSPQHPLSTAAIAATTTGTATRVGISTFNVLGDIGKLGLPALAAALITFLGPQLGMRCLAGLTFALALVLAFLYRGVPVCAQTRSASEPEPGGFEQLSPRLPSTRAYWLLLLATVMDGASRVGMWVFLPFVLVAKGADTAAVGLAVSSLFLGGMAGKTASGFVAIRLGTFASVAVTEVVTALLCAAIWFADLHVALILCPVLGCALNGTSTALFGSVVELVPAKLITKAYSLFYTFTIGVNALSPFFFGSLSDAFGLSFGIAFSASLAVLAIGATYPLRRRLPAAARTLN